MRDPVFSTRVALIRAATDLLEEGGPAAVTLRSVAQRVGVSHNAPYRHFEDKKALLAAVATELFRQLGGIFAPPSGESGSPRETLFQGIREYVAFAHRYPAHYRLLFSDPDMGQAGGELEEAALALFRSVVALVSAAQKAGEIIDMDPVSLTALIYATTHGLVDLELSGRASAGKGLGNPEAILSELERILRPS